MVSQEILARRATMPVRIFALSEEPRDDLTASSTPAERVEMVVALSARMLEFTATPGPSYTRHTMPVRLLRPR